MNAALPLPWRIHRVYQRIARLQNLSVNEETLALFNELLVILRKHSDSELLSSDPYLQAIAQPLRRIFAGAAYAYEKHWAEKLLEMPDITAALQEHYPYREHYERATRLEFQALEACTEKPIRHILMVGSGPLPMTSIQLAKNSEANLCIDNLDINGEATAIGQQICQNLGLAKHMNFLTGDVLDKADLNRYDAVWLAALAGDSHNKARLLKHLHTQMQPGALLLARTACQLRGLIYPSITTTDLTPFTLRLKIQTYSDNFHSIYLVQR